VSEGNNGNVPYLTVPLSEHSLADWLAKWLASHQRGAWTAALQSADLC
jgi:hypothetical protein